MTHIHHLLRPASHALMIHPPALDLILRLRQSAIGTQYERFNVFMHQGLQRRVGVRSVDHGPRIIHILVRIVKGRLRSQFGSEEFGDFAGIAFESRAEIDDVGQDGFDAVALAFDFTVDGRHFVTVFGIVYGGEAGDVDDVAGSSHCDCIDCMLLKKREEEVGCRCNNNGNDFVAACA